MLQIKTGIVLALTTFLLIQQLTAQEKNDTKSVEITSSYKPVLINNPKINLIAAPPVKDNSTPNLTYDVPNKSLSFAYQPGSLKPLALEIDSVTPFNNSNFIKLGFGSLKTPYLHAGFSLGDGLNSGANLMAKYVSSQSNRNFQKFNETSAKASAFYKLASGQELAGSLGFRQDKTYKYGYMPDTLLFPSDSLLQRFSTISGTVTFRNYRNNNLGINYYPSLNIHVFSDNRKNSESNSILNLPLEKALGDLFAVKLNLNFDFTRFSPDDKDALNNFTWHFAPTVFYKTPNLRLNAGIRPSWDNGTFKMFPNLMGEIGTSDSRFTFQAGWSGYIRKTTYQYLASQNYWLQAPDSLKNTWIDERFAGFKGSLSEHFTYSAKVAFNQLNNQPLFINYPVANSGDGKTFYVVNEPKMNVLNLGGEVALQVEEKISILSGLNFNQYTNLAVNEKAWGLPVMEWNSTIRVQVLKDLVVKGDFFVFNGMPYRAKGGGVSKTAGAFDLNAGIEFKIWKNISLWTQFNNIANKPYQRWNQYPVYGFNLLGGIIFNFDQNSKQ